MYAFVEGKLSQINPMCVVLNVGGLGFQIHIPTRILDQLPPLGENLFLYTSFQIREASQTLYGFLVEEEKELFEVLISLSGIGPKHALAMITTYTLSDLSQIVSKADVNALKRVPGIGKKTAERLLLDLKDKLPACSHPCDFAIPLSPEKQQIRDAMAALINLGYTQSTAQNAVKRSLDSLGGAPTLSELITTALNHIN